MRLSFPCPVPQLAVGQLGLLNQHRLFQLVHVIELIKLGKLSVVRVQYYGVCAGSAASPKRHRCEASGKIRE